MKRHSITKYKGQGQKQQGSGKQTYKGCRNNLTFFFFLGEEPEKRCFHPIGQQGVKIGGVNKVDGAFGVTF